jgi:hypothetical protein
MHQFYKYAFFCNLLHNPILILEVKKLNTVNVSRIYPWIHSVDRRAGIQTDLISNEAVFSLQPLTGMFPSWHIL